MYYDDHNFYKCINTVIITTSNNTVIAVDFIFYIKDFLLMLE